MTVRTVFDRYVNVVDALPADYVDIGETLASEGLGLHLFKCAGAALRHTAGSELEMWVINMKLPDMSGPDLLAMLRTRYPGVPVCLVSDSYRAEEEIRARCSGAELYLCKPLCGEWLAAIYATA
jgi:DNA-binding response OmpR family regulator